jgi:hypothetical protein
MFMDGKYASEGNPLMKKLVENPALMYGTKAGAGLLLNWLADKMSKRRSPSNGKRTRGWSNRANRINRFSQHGRNQKQTSQQRVGS